MLLLLDLVGLRAQEHAYEFEVAVGAADIFGRTAASALDARRGLRRRVRGEELFERHRVTPAVAEVVGVDEGQRALVIEVEVAQPHGSGVEALRVLVGHVLIEQLGVTEAQAADLELVEMRVGPAHGRLKDVMQLGERGLKRHDEASAYGWLDAHQRNPHLDGIRLFPSCMQRCRALRRHKWLP